MNFFDYAREKDLQELTQKLVDQQKIWYDDAYGLDQCRSGDSWDLRDKFSILQQAAVTVIAFLVYDEPRTSWLKFLKAWADLEKEGHIR